MGLGRTLRIELLPDRRGVLMLLMAAIWLLMAVPLFFFPGCLCCGETCNLCDTGDTMSRCWEIAIAGVTNGTCTGCSAFNGTHVLEIINGSPTCEHNNDGTLSANCNNFPFGCVSDNPEFSMVINGGTWTLEIIAPTCSSQYATYSLTAGSGTSDFDCDGDNDFSKNFNGPNCGNFPNTITATPVACP